MRKKGTLKALKGRMQEGFEGKGDNWNVADMQLRGSCVSLNPPSPPRNLSLANLLARHVHTKGGRHTETLLVA